MFAQKINKLHMLTPLWREAPYILKVWFLLLMHRNEKAIIEYSFDELKTLSLMDDDQFDSAIDYLLGKREINKIKYITETENGYKINCLDSKENKKINSMPKWKEKSKDGFDEYVRLSNEAYDEIIIDYGYLLYLKELYPNHDIRQSIRAAFLKYWGTEKAWLRKRRQHVNKINWRETLINTLKFHLVKIDNSSNDYEFEYLMKKYKSEQQLNNNAI